MFPFRFTRVKTSPTPHPETLLKSSHGNRPARDPPPPSFTPLKLLSARRLCAREHVSRSVPRELLLSL
ncbi:hypothetical protein TNCV_2951801 [Trichonephila clavipes]|nr:hypothetical protein TNCV_2951801 [Trichonephila clavipes]